MNLDLSSLPAFVPRSRDVNVVVDTPQGSHHKFKYDEATGLFTLRHVLPAGAVFPFEFGFIPSTRTGDGDPLDVLILLQGATFPGCLVRARLIGVIEAEQRKSGAKKAKPERNDRLVAVPAESRAHHHLRELRHLPTPLVAEIEHFFVSYNKLRGVDFKPRGRHGSSRALALVRKALQAAVPSVAES